MDANTKNSKFIAIALTAFMVFSSLVAGFASAHVEGDNTSRLTSIDPDFDDPSGAANAILHWDHDYDCDDEIGGVQEDCDDDSSTDFYVDSPSAGEVLYNHIYDLIFVGIPPCPVNTGTDVDCVPEGDGDVALVDNDEVAIYMESWDNDVDPGTFGSEGWDGITGGADFEVETETLDIDHDQEHCEGLDFEYDEDEDECLTDLFYVAFEGINFNTGAGTFYVVQVSSENVIGQFTVNQTDEVDLTLDPETFTYIYEETPEIDATATHDGDGVEDVSLESEDGMIEEVSIDATSSSGRATIDFDDDDGIHPPAGTWTIIARQDVTICNADTLCEDEDEEEIDDSTIAAEPDVLGEAQLVVDSNTIVVEPDSTDVLGGFRQSASYMFLFPEEDEDETDGTCDGEEGNNVIFPGFETEDDSDGDAAGCNNGLLYGEREFEVANLSVRAPNGDEYWLNMTYADWDDGVSDVDMTFCFDLDGAEAGEGDDEDDDCDSFGDGDDNWDAPLLVTLEDDGTVSFRPNPDFEHPLEIEDDEIGALSDDQSVWLSGTYNVTLDVSTSGLGTNGDGSSYELCEDDLVTCEADSDDITDAANFPEYTNAWNLETGNVAALNLELAVDPTGGIDPESADVVTADSVDVQKLVVGDAIPTQTLFITVYGNNINDHPLCPDDILEDIEIDARDEGDCATEDNDDLDIDDGDVALDVLTDAEDDFVDEVEVDGDLLPGWEVESYTASTGILIISGVTPTQAGNITVMVNFDGDTATLTIPVETGAKIDVDTTELIVGEDTDVTATVRDAFGGLVTTADLTLVNVDGEGADSFSDDFDLSPSSGEISGTGSAGRGLGGEYDYSINPDVNTDLLIFALIGEGADETYAWALLNVNPAHDLGVDLKTPDKTMASVTTPVQLDLTADWEGAEDDFEVEEVDVWFIHEDGWEDFTEDGAEALADLETDDDAVQVDDLDFDEMTVFFNVTLKPGNYTILVCDLDCESADSAHDNGGDDMPTFAVNKFTATFSPMQVANDEEIEDDVRVTVHVVDSSGKGANGTLVSIKKTIDADDPEEWEDETEGEFDATTITAVITNGWGNFTGVTGTEVGRVAFAFNPTPSSDDPEESIVSGYFWVVGPNLTITPSSVRIGQVTLVAVQASDFGGHGLPARLVQFCTPGINDFPSDEGDIDDLEDGFLDLETDDEDADGDFDTLATDEEYEDFFADACPSSGITGPDGSTNIAVNPTTTTPYRVYVNNSYAGATLPVVIGTITLTVNPTAPAVGQTVTATATLTGVTSGSNAGISIVAKRDGTQVLSALTDAAGHATIPAVTAGNYTVTATRTGFGSATASFTVGATPPVTPSCIELDNLVLPSTVNVGTPVTVSAEVTNTCDEAQNATAVLLVNNAQRDTQSVSLDANGNETVTYTFTPTVAGTYAVSIRIGTVTLGPNNIVVGTPNGTTPTPPTGTTPPPTGTTPPPPTGTTPPPPTGTPPTASTNPTPATTPKVPGFEVVALLGALAVAMVVLGRRNRN